MSMRFGVLLIKLYVLSLIIDVEASVYDQNVNFIVFKNDSNDGIYSNFEDPLPCDRDGLFTFIVHGWTESIESEWAMPMIRNFTLHRGGCVIFMDYPRYSKNRNYFGLVTHFKGLSATLTKKILQATSNYDNVFIFGFSFGSRLAFEAGSTIGYQTINRIDACDPAGPGFDSRSSTVDPKFAAKFVNCINTSTDKGTRNYNCHINFRMGVCGQKQVGSTNKYPCGSHGMCPWLYNSAFINDFVKDNYHNCSSKRLANVPDDFKMGYLEKRMSFLHYGDVFIPTSKYSPWNVQPGQNVIDTR